MTDFKDLIISAENKYNFLYFFNGKQDNEKQLACLFDVPETEIPHLCTTGSTSELSLTSRKNVLLTESTIYYKNGNNASVSIPFSKLDSFYISFDTAHKKVSMVTIAGRIELYAPRLVYTDRTAFELYDLLQSIQKKLISDSHSSKERFLSVLDQLASAVSVQFKKDAYLTEESKALLRGILDIAPDNLVAEMVLQEDRYRSFDGSYGTSSHEKEFFSNYLNRIADDYSTKLYRVMVRSYASLLSREKLSLRDAYLLCALGYRMNDERTYLLYNRISRSLSKSQQQFLQYLAARSSREQMDQSLNRMLTGSIPTEIECSYTDDMGFDCLHYALILEEKEIVSALLKSRNWGEGSPDHTVGIANAFYNYFFLAVWHINDTIFLKEVFLNTRPEGGDSLKTLHRIASLMEIASSRMSLVKNRLMGISLKKEQALTSGNPMVYSDYEMTRTALLEEKHDIELEIEYLKSWKTRTDNEIDELYEKALADTRDIISSLTVSANPMVKYLRSRLISPDSFISLHAMPPEAYLLQRYRGLYFLGDDGETFRSVSYSQITETEKSDRDLLFSADAPEVSNPWKEKHEENNKENQNGSKTNSDSYDSTVATYERNTKIRWFSEAALTNAGILKKEYHLLIKKYHPDETGYDSSANTLRDIIEEKDRILKSQKSSFK